MKEKIKEVQDYFKNKILKGEFTIIKTDECTVTLTVDDDYKFGFLVGKFPTSQYNWADSNFIDLELNKYERESLKVLIDPIVNDYKRNVLLATKRAELAELENELNNG